jgi:hypothetical protein
MGIVVAALSACGGSDVNCVTPPCALPMALTITLTSATATGPVNGAVVQVSGALAGSCGGSPTVCFVPGYAGTYNLSISAPGFQTATRSVTVTEIPAPSCGCRGANTEHIDVALVAGP